jgi:hypothetical protein
LDSAAKASNADPRPWLSGPALELYEHLEAIGHIERLKQMPHLGAAAWIHPHLTHTRWDYQALLLRLSARVAPSVFDGMGDFEIEGHRVGTAHDLLQCWAMLHYSGALWGTDATERLVLDALRASNRARRLFIEGMTTDDDKAYGEYVLRSYQFYNVHWALSTGFLHMLPEHRDAPGRPMWLALLRAYRDHARYGAAVIRMFGAQRRLRRLAYVYLDLTHAQLPVAMDLSAVERDLSTRPERLLSPEDNRLDVALDQVESYMELEVYLAPDVILAYRLLDLYARDQLVQDLSSATSPGELYAQLNAMRTRQAWPVVARVIEACKSGDHVHLHRTRRAQPASMTEDEFFAQLPGLQSRFQRAVGADALVQVYVGGPGSQQLIDFYVGREIAPADLARTLTAVCREIARPPARGPRPHGPRPGAASDASSPEPQPGEGPQVRELVASVLSLMLPGTARVRIEESPSHPASFVLVDRRHNAYARRLVERMLRTSPEGARHHELEVLQASLRAHPATGFRAVIANGFQVERKAENSPGEAEFDGAYLDVTADDVTLHLIEAKSAASSAVALRQLRRRLRRLGWLEGTQIAPIEGGAEAMIPVCRHCWR